MKPATEEDVFDLQIGLGESETSVEDKHFFDTAGYLVLEDLLTLNQVSQAQDTLARVKAATPKNITLLQEGSHGCELVNIIEGRDTVEDAMALPRVLNYVQEFIWGRQYRLVGSRAILRAPGKGSQLTQGGDADPRRYARYRCFGDGQFRCLMITCLITLTDTTDGDGAFCVIPASHKASLPHPYENMDLAAIQPLCTAFRYELDRVFYSPRTCRTRSNRQPMKRILGCRISTVLRIWSIGPRCEPSADLLARTAADPAKSHLLLEPYYHPARLTEEAKVGATLVVALWTVVGTGCLTCPFCHRGDRLPNLSIFGLNMSKGKLPLSDAPGQ